MPTKITLIIDNPADPAAFEEAYTEVESLARRLPGLRRTEAAKVWPKEDGSETPAYRVLDMYFTDYDAASRAVTTEEASAFVAKVFEQGEAFGDVLVHDLGRREAERAQPGR